MKYIINSMLIKSMNPVRIYISKMLFDSLFHLMSHILIVQLSDPKHGITLGVNIAQQSDHIRPQ